MSEEIIGKAKPHTVKKFELIAGYVKGWKEKLLNNSACKKLVFIDCMSNSGEYRDIQGRQVFGTPVLVDSLLRNAALIYSDKIIQVILNDISAGKIAHLKTLIPEGGSNYHVSFHNEDCNELLYKLHHEICGVNGTHYLLFYDPYRATIDWDAIMPFLNNWGEVIINHMMSDTIRATKAAKYPEAVSKYEATYKTSLVNLVEWGSDRKAYEECIENVIRSLRQQHGRDYFIATFPFFNTKNALVYDLIHCTSNIVGFNLFKKTAWQVFGGSSSNKDIRAEERQGTFSFFTNEGTDDEYCYNVGDIARYLQGKLRGCKNVKLSEVWGLLESHPIFPSEGFSRKIKAILKQDYGATTSRSTITFSSMEPTS